MRNEMNYSHGLSGTPEYKAWKAMKDRCFNPNNQYYSNYGGRGISVCDRWKNSFQNFFLDMGSRPTAKHSLDRIDNNADYFPKNCRWTTRVEQENNKRSNRFITIGCVTLTIAQWTKEMGYGQSVIQSRLKDGWSEFDAVMTPVRFRSKSSKKLSRNPQ